MPHALRFQVMSLPNVPMRELIDRFLWLEELGIEVGGVADHFVDWLRPREPWFECWTAVAALASRTSTIRLATCISQIPLRGPAMLARQAMTVDHVSQGRLDLGLGTGLTSDPSYAMMGLPNWSARERVDRFSEYVAIVDKLLSNRLATYSGDHYEVVDASMNPPPVQKPRPPIMVAALAPRMLRQAVLHADIWNSLSFHADFETQMAETRSRVESVKRLCARSGRDPATLRCSYTMFDAASRSRNGRIAYYDSQELFVDTVERAVTLGMSELVLYFPSDERQLAAFETIAREVLPQLRKRHAGGISLARSGRGQSAVTGSIPASSQSSETSDPLTMR